MHDKEPTNADTLQELQLLRQRVADLEASADKSLFTEAAVDAQLDTFFVFDPATGIPIRWNQSFRDISGYTDAEIASMKAPNDWYDENDLKLAAEAVSKNTAGEKLTVELNLITKSGKRIPTEYSTAIVNDKNGNACIISVGRDITERKKMEQALQKNIIALTQPLDSSKIAFDDLFNINDIQKLQDEFADATGVASIITHTDGTPITKSSNFCCLCNDIIRKTKKGLANCYRSDAALGKPSSHGPTIQPCMSGGLWDAGAAISVGGNHVANWLIGQVRDETQREDAMRAYAREIEADEDEFIKAFREVPSMTREQFDKVAQALFTLADQLSNTAYQNLQQARFIAERKQAEALIIAEQKKYSAFLDNLEAGVVAHAPDTSVLFCNRRAPEILGLTMDQMLGKTAMDPQWKFVDVDGSILVLDSYPVNKVLKTMSKLKQCVLGIRRADRDYLTWVSCNGLPVLDESGELDHILVSFYDITERLQAEERERQLQAKLARAERLEATALLAGGVAHDLNNVLGPMVLLTETIKEDVRELIPETNDLSEDVAESLDMIHSTAVRAAKVVRELTGLSRHGRFDMSPMLINTLPFILGKCEILDSIRINSPQIAIEFNITPEKLCIMGASEHLIRVFHNLFLNAAQSIENRGTITISAQPIILSDQYFGYEPIPPDEYAVITIADTGTGIPIDDQDHIFDPFFTSKQRTEHSGSGLGLSVVHGIVKDHKGFIDVQSEPNKGSAFSIYLPLTKNAIPENTDKDVAPIEGGSESVLVVDDEPGQRFLAQRGLTSLGYSVQVVENGEEALDLFKEHWESGHTRSPFDLVIMDMIMVGDFDGLDTLQAILTLYPKQKVIISSGYAEGECAAAAKKLGASWLTKPYLRADLAKTVRDKLDS